MAALSTDVGAACAQEDDSSLKALGLATVSYLFEALRDDEPVVSSALQSACDALALLPRTALANEWNSTPTRRVLPLICNGAYNFAQYGAHGVDAGPVLATASTDTPAPASGALGGQDASGWVGAKGAASSFWQLQLAQPFFLDHVLVTWAQDGTPLSATLSTSSDGVVWTPVGTPHTPDNVTPADEMELWRVPINGMVQYLRLDMRGMATRRHPRVPEASVTGKDKLHKLKLFEVFVPDTLGLHVHPSAMLSGLEACLTSSAQRAEEAAGVARSMRGLQWLATSTGSVQSLLQLTNVALSVAEPLPAVPDFPLPAPSVPAARISVPDLAQLVPAAELTTFVSTLDGAINERLEAMYSETGVDAPGLKPEFDPGCCSSGIELSNNNTVMRTTSGSRTAVYATRGFSTGRVVWVFKCETDTLNDEYLCYGLGIKPKNDDSYDNSPNLWMIRGYNGRVHQHGTSGRSIEKIHPNDVVRFEMNCEEGTCVVFINDVSQGVVFDGLSGKEVFPAMCGYGSNRSASFQSLTWSGSASSAGGSTPITSLPEKADGFANAKEETTGFFYRDGQLEESETGDDKKPRIVVRGEERADGISLRPDIISNANSTAQYPLVVMVPSEKEGGKESDKMVKGKPFEYFTAVAAVDDSSSNVMDGAHAVQPVVIAVVLDGREAFATPPLRTPGETCHIRVHVKNASNLVLVARLADGSSVAAAGRPVAKTVLYSAGVQRDRVWTWNARRSGQLPAITEVAEGGAEVTLAVPRKPLSFARYLLSRVSFLADLQDELIRRATAAVAKVVRATGVDATQPLATIIAAGKTYVAQAAGIKASPTTPPLLKESDLAPLQAVAARVGAFSLDVSAATFDLLRTLLLRSLRGAWVEAAAAGGADAAADVEDSAARPWTTISHSLLRIVKAHLRQLVLLGVPLASVGIQTSKPAVAAADACGADASLWTATSLRVAAAARVAGRGDSASTHIRDCGGKAALLDASAATTGVFGPGSSAAGSADLAVLVSLHKLLQTVVAEDDAPPAGDDGVASSVNGFPRVLRITASSAIDAGLSVLYPTQADRRRLLNTLVARGGTLDVLLAFPLKRAPAASAATAAASGDKSKKEKEKEKEKPATFKELYDPRADRAIMLLQLECERMGLEFSVSGAWDAGVRVLIKLPPSNSASPAGSRKVDAAEFLDAGFARIMDRAGFGKWSIPSGCSDPLIPLRIERIFDPAVQDMKLVDTVGAVRLLPQSAVAYESAVSVLEALAAGASAGGAASA